MAISGAEHGLSPIPNKRKEHGQPFNKRLAAGALAGIITVGALAGIYESTQGNKDNKPDSSPTALPGEVIKSSSQPSNEIVLPSQTPIAVENTPLPTLGNDTEKLFSIEGLSPEDQGRVEALKFWLLTVQPQNTTSTSKDGASTINVKIQSNALESFADEIPNILTVGFSQTPLEINYDYTSITPEGNGMASGYRNVGKIKMSNISASQFETSELSDQAKNDGVDIMGKVTISADSNSVFDIFQTDNSASLDQKALEKYFSEKAVFPNVTLDRQEKTFITVYRQNGQWHYGRYPDSSYLYDFVVSPEVQVLNNIGCDPNQGSQYCSFQEISRLP